MEETEVDKTNSNSDPSQDVDFVVPDTIPDDETDGEAMIPGDTVLKGEVVEEPELPSGQELQFEPTSSDLLSKIQTVEEWSPRVNIGIYGDPGGGKTVLACTAPKPLLIDVERGALSLKNHPELSGTKVLPINSFQEIDQVVGLLKNNKIPDVETVIIDTGSELQMRHLSEHVKVQAAKDSNRSKFLALGKDYQENTEVMRRTFSAFRDLPYHLVIICHTVEQTDGETGMMFKRPALSPKVAGTFLGIMDLIGYLTFDAESGNRNLQVMPTVRVQAKTRIGGLPPVMVNPTFNDIVAAHIKSKK